MQASATGERSKHSLLSWAAPKTKAADITTTKIMASAFDIRPAGSSRFAVRGFPRSNLASTSRLKPIAALRAVTMHTTIHAASDQLTGRRREASSAPVSANGNAKTEWLKRTNDRYVRIRLIINHENPSSTRILLGSARRSTGPGEIFPCGVRDSPE